MDLGATICKRTKPLCHQCPMADICEAKKQNRIDELPRKKLPPKVQTLPLYWLIIHHTDGALLLEKRPTKGIWGGLYCVPCFEKLDDLYAYAERFGIVSDGLEEQTTFTHRLTHRLLMITPFQTQQRPSEHLSDGLWISSEQLADYGLPKPLLKYLAKAKPPYSTISLNTTSFPPRISTANPSPICQRELGLAYSTP